MNQKKYFVVEESQSDAGEFLSRYSKDILALWDKNLSQNFEGRYTWLYKENPSGSAKTYLALDEQNNVVGCASVYPRQVSVKGRDLIMGVAADFAVNKEHRVFGPALRMQQTILSSYGKKGIDFLFAFPNKSSAGIFKRIGFVKLGNECNLIRILNSGNKVRAFIKNRVLAYIVTVYINGVLRLADFVRYIFTRHDSEFMVLDAIDKRFNELWKNAEKNDCILGVQSYEYLSWRYSGCKAFDSRYFCMFDRKTGSLEGFIVFTLKDNIAVIWDMLAKNRISALKALIANFVKLMNRQKAEKITTSILDSRECKALFKHAGFIERCSDRMAMVFISPESGITNKNELLQKDNWFIFEGEMDI
ncbi:MAG: GNAT family N-acetyltransferase [Candidatus Omnitrophota bacterium]